MSTTEAPAPPRRGDLLATVAFAWPVITCVVGMAYGALHPTETNGFGRPIPGGGKDVATSVSLAGAAVSAVVIFVARRGYRLLAVAALVVNLFIAAALATILY